MVYFRWLNHTGTVNFTKRFKTTTIATQDSSKLNENGIDEDGNPTDEMTNKLPSELSYITKGMLQPMKQKIVYKHLFKQQK